MDFRYFLNLIFLFVVNVCFFLSGICLNSLVIISFWRSAQLRKKLCYFMIMVLSCCDLLTIATNHSVMAFITMLWLIENGNPGSITWVDNAVEISNAFIRFSLLALLVMSFDRYLATYHPMYHRTSVTKGKLLALLAMLIFVELVTLTLHLNFLISHNVAAVIPFTIVAPPMLFLNFKLFTIAKKNRRIGAPSLDTRKAFSFKNISSCLLAVACFVALSVPTFIYIGVGLRMNSNTNGSSEDTRGNAAMWSKTIGSMNGTFNCLIFYWKNAILRTEGMKIIKSILPQKPATSEEYPEPRIPGTAN